MNRSELIAATASKRGRSQDDVREIIDALEVVICDEIRSGGDVRWGGLLKIESVYRPEHQGRNPTNGKTITVPAKTVARLEPFVNLKEAAAASG